MVGSINTAKQKDPTALFQWEAPLSPCPFPTPMHYPQGVESEVGLVCGFLSNPFVKISVNQFSGLNFLGVVIVILGVSKRVEVSFFDWSVMDDRRPHGSFFQYPPSGLHASPHRSSSLSSDRER
ncbi:hypothetical protein CK203_050262 [Vitis vinifera]|uniref:Uncharacterized protein n=1 Tax=Vitis vinifera TaxID=29760 RepID=A0A438GZ06_VITVI|nr:hypothetical protein CK203_050262 [Vitis vinifera]